MADPKTIMHSKVLVVEGLDAQMFCVWALDAYKLDDIEVWNFGGITQLTEYMQAFKLRTGFNLVKTIGVIRDAENDKLGAERSIKKSFKDSGFIVPQNMLEWQVGGSIKTGYMILPGKDDLYDENGKGALEHLCLGSINDDCLLECVNEFTGLVKGKSISLPCEHKTKLNSYLAITQYVGMKVGEAAKAGAWDWQSPAMEVFHEFLQSM